MSINILCVGDVVGKPGRRMLAGHLKRLITELNIDLVVCNPENAAGGSGLTPQLYAKFLHYGVDVMTLGDHIYRKKEITQTLGKSDRLLRPANLSPKAIGRRFTVVPTKDGRTQVAVACLLGQMYMGNNDSPWTEAERLMADIPEAVKVRVLDFHAEATSEKIAMGWFLNGRASIVFGTHTHVATADCRVLDAGTAFISDVGMTGPHDGVLGRKKDRVLYHLTTQMPTPFAIAEGDPRISALLATVDEKTGRASDVKPVIVCGYADENADENADADGEE